MMNDHNRKVFIILKLFILIDHFSIDSNVFVLGQSCGPRISPRLLKEIPCDLSILGYCTEPGSAYPWSSVRRYIIENQGLVKKMYGEQRQSDIVHDEMKRINEQYRFIPDELSRLSRQRTIKQLNSESDNDNNNDVDNKIADNMTILTNNLDDVNVENEYLTTIKNSNNQPANSNPNVEDLLENTSTLENELITDPMATTTGNSIDIIKDDQLSDQDQEDKEQVKGYNACPITQEVVAPYWANNTRGETLALLNVYPFEQYIHWEKCSFEGEQMFCRDGCRCEQQFRLHRLLAFDPKNECRGIFADWFRFPGCCVCICYDKDERINNRKSRL